MGMPLIISGFDWELDLQTPFTSREFAEKEDKLDLAVEGINSCYNTEKRIDWVGLLRVLTAGWHFSLDFNDMSMVHPGVDISCT